jgi:hypothetical protein
MTIAEFNLLSEEEQDELVTDHGIYLLNYIQGDIMCDVYKVHNFFVKTCYNLISDEKPWIIYFSDDTDFNLFINNSHSS